MSCSAGYQLNLCVQTTLHRQDTALIKCPPCPQGMQQQLQPAQQTPQQLPASSLWHATILRKQPAATVHQPPWQRISAHQYCSCTMLADAHVPQTGAYQPAPPKLAANCAQRCPGVSHPDMRGSSDLRVTHQLHNNGRMQAHTTQQHLAPHGQHYVWLNRHCCGAAPTGPHLNACTSTANTVPREGVQSAAWCRPYMAGNCGANPAHPHRVGGRQHRASLTRPSNGIHTPLLSSDGKRPCNTAMANCHMAEHPQLWTSHRWPCCLPYPDRCSDPTQVHNCLLGAAACWSPTQAAKRQGQQIRCQQKLITGSIHGARVAAPGGAAMGRACTWRCATLGAQCFISYNPPPLTPPASLAVWSTVNQLPSPGQPYLPFHGLSPAAAGARCWSTDHDDMSAFKLAATQLLHTRQACPVWAQPATIT